MHIAITGASGMIGSALVPALREAGHEVTRLVRRTPSAADERGWDPAGHLPPAAVADVDAVVHLAAEPIEPKPLTRAKRERLRASRVRGTETIARALAGLDDGPRVLLSASGTNWYGDRGDETLTEADPPGDDGFLSRISRAWEQAVEPARAAGLRVVVMRTGIVLAPDATVIRALGLVTKLGGAAPLGSGQQFWPWIGMPDVVGLYRHVLEHDAIDGVLNLVAPQEATNEEFTRTLARVMNRWVVPIRVPGIVPGLYLGRDMARSLLLTSMRVQPVRALETGYRFAYPTLEEALREVVR